jgi:CBS domain containing-hemolysin-like protein
MIGLLIVFVIVTIAALLAMADGALLATGAVPPSEVVRDPERAHRALILTRILAHLGAGVGIGSAALRMLGPSTTTVVIAVTAVVVVVTVVEGIARHAGYARGLRVATHLAPVIVAADALFLPASVLGTAIEGMLSRLFPPADDTPLRREADAGHFRHVVAVEAQISEDEGDLLHGAFSLGDTSVREVMVPRVDVIGIERDAPWSEVLDRVRSSEHARFPVFKDTLDNVLGVLYAKDLLSSVVRREEPQDWTTLVRPAVFIPDTKSVNDQLRDFKAQRTHIALVVDEYGGIAGIVTIEDILEVIVGDIQDEYDADEPDVRHEGNDRFWVAGEVSLADLSDILGTNLERDSLTTVGGLLYDAFGRVPSAGESVDIAGFRVVVERVRRRRIERVYFERQHAESPS